MLREIAAPAVFFFLDVATWLRCDFDHILINCAALLSNNSDVQRWERNSLNTAAAGAVIAQQDGSSCSSHASSLSADYPCAGMLGMVSGQISDAQISASSYADRGWVAENARLLTGRSGWTGQQTKQPFRNEWLQVRSQFNKSSVFIFK